MELLGSPNASEKLTEQRQEEKKSNHSYSNIQKNALTRLQMVLQVVEWTEWKREMIIPPKAEWAQNDGITQCVIS